MRCLKCKAKAVMEIRRHNAAFCRPHFLEYFDRQVSRNIRRYRMCTPEDRILVAVSGGKDSLALWDVLTRLGFKTAGLHIHLGIGDYSPRGYQVAVSFAREQALELIPVDLAREYGMSVPELSKTLHRAPCSGCGLSRRYIFNREALKRGYRIVATGHNLDDESATLLGNVLHWQTETLTRHSPVLESTHPRLVKKIKPLFSLTEKETASYCIINRIFYHEEECPNSLGARSLLYKEAMNHIELHSPGAKQRFFQGFLERGKPALKPETTKIGECFSCGQPTTAETCAFCRMWNDALARRRKRRARGEQARFGA